MIYVVAGGVALGQCIAADEWLVAPLWVALAGAIGLCVAAGQTHERGRHVWAALGALAVATATGAVLVDRVERPPADPTHVSSLRLPWRGEVSAIVVAEPVRRPDRTTVVVDVLRLGSGANARRMHGRVRLTLRRHRALHAGDRVRAWVTLRRPRSFRSIGAFDFAGYLARRGIYVTGSVWEAPALRRTGRQPASLSSMVVRWRRAAARALVHGVDEPTRQVLGALVLGRGDTLTPELRESFRRAGVFHVLVVSGLHVTLVAGVAARLLAIMLARSERLLLATDVERLARVAGLVPVAAYVVLVGPSVSVTRATAASGLAVLALACGRRAAPGRLWALALLFVAALWPGSPREAGFQLSFASVAGVLLAMRRPQPASASAWRRIGRLLAIATSVTVVTAPLAALHFDAVAPMGIVANPIVVPLFGSAVLGPGLLAAAIAPLAPSAAATLFGVAGWLAQPGLAAVRVLGGSWAPMLGVPRPSGLELVVLHALLLGWFWRERVDGRRLAVAAALALALDVGWWMRERLAPGRLRVAFLDVGQGDATVVELSDGRVLVVDAGGFPYGDFDTGRAVVEPYLRARKIAHLEALVMSHAHPDHARGLPRLVERFAPREFWWAGTGGEGPAWAAVVEALARHDVPIRMLGRGDAPPGFEEGIVALHPPSGWRAAGLNDRSLVLALRAAGTRVLLTGDIETMSETAMRGAADLASAVVKVPHHGSRTSSTPAWLAAVSPRIAVISVGADNPYGLPAPEVERRYRASGACVLRTDVCGTVTVVARRGDVHARGMAAGCRCPPAPG